MMKVFFFLLSKQVIGLKADTGISREIYRYIDLIVRNSVIAERL